MRLRRLALLAFLAPLAPIVPARAQGIITGVVHDSLARRAPLAGARVVIEGLPGESITDRRGRFRLGPIPAGEYLLTFFHPQLDSLRLTAPVYRIQVPSKGTRRVALAVPSYASISRFLCGYPLDDASGIVLGRVRSAEDLTPLAGAEARVSWFDATLGERLRVLKVDRVAADTSDATGAFVLCGVPADVELYMHVRKGRQGTGPLALSRGGPPIQIRELTLSLSDPAAVADAEAFGEIPPEIAPPATEPPVPARPSVGPAESREVPRGSAALRVTVSGVSGRPLPQAIVTVRGLAESDTTATDGVARLTGVPAGSQTVLVRAVGLQPLEAIVNVMPGRETHVELAMGRAAEVLPEVRVTGLAPDAMAEARMRRMRGGTGVFLDSAELDRRGRSVAALATVRGVRVPSMMGMPGSNPEFNAMLDPLPMFRSAGGAYCLPTFVVDGSPVVRMEGRQFRMLMEMAKFIEVYPRGTMAPAEIAAAPGCGVIVLWTF